MISNNNKLHGWSESEETDEDSQEDEAGDDQRNERDFGELGHAVVEG